MIFEALQARYGDCLLLTLPSGREVVRLLVDGGPPTVYRNALEPRLTSLRADLELEDDAPLPLEAIMVSHVDEDHITGVLELFGAIRQAEDSHRSPPYDVRTLLHNSLDSLMGEGEGGSARGLRRETILAGLGGEDGLRSLLKGDANQTALLVLQSYAQGSKLATTAAALSVQRNPPDERTIMLKGTKPRVFRMGETRITIVGPLEQEVEELREKWSAYKGGHSSDAELAAYLDKSVPNFSSLVAHIECGGSTILLTGDARGDNILKGLEDADLLAPGSSMNVDILKLPHHGSSRNVDGDFFSRVHANHYVASGDGTYGNPDRATFELLARQRPRDDYTIHLTYTPAQCDKMHKTWKAAGKKRGAYVASEHSLAGLFRAWESAHPNVTIRKGGAVRIQL